MSTSISNHASLPIVGWRLQLTERGTSDTEKGVMLATTLAATAIVVTLLMGIGDPYGLMCSATILSCSAVVLWSGTDRSIRFIKHDGRTRTDRIGNLALAAFGLFVLLAGLIVVSIAQIAA